MKKVKLHGGSKQGEPRSQVLSLPSVANVTERGKQITDAVSNTFQQGSERIDNIITKLAKTPKMGPIEKRSVERQSVEEQEQSSEQQFIFKELAEMRSILESLLIP